MERKFNNPAEKVEEMRINTEINREKIEESQDVLTKYMFMNSVALCKCAKIKKVIFNNPATIVFWSDDKKTVVKCSGDEAFDEEKGLAMAIAKRFLGNRGNYYNEFKKWLPEIGVCEDRIPCKDAVKAFDGFGKSVRIFKGDNKQ